MSKEITNKITASSLVTIDLEDWYPNDIEIIDIAQFLYQGLLLKEKDFREALKTYSWKEYNDKNIVLICSVDAIIPTWAYMLIAVNLANRAKKITFGTKEKLIEEIYSEKIDLLNLNDYTDKRVVIKGCSKKSIPILVYVKLSAKIKPVVKSLMYGEPCSTVPLYKK